MQIDQARSGYIRWLLATRDLSPHTIRAYDADLASFERYLGTDFAVAEIDQESVLSFIERQKAAEPRRPRSGGEQQPYAVSVGG